MKKKRIIFKRYMDEDAPANNAGSGNIAGLGVGPQGEPGFTPKVMKKYKKRNQDGVDTQNANVSSLMRRAQPNTVSEAKTGTFAGHKTFIVPSNVFLKARHQKRTGGHWKSYIGEDECGMHIRDYANTNQNKPIILQDEDTGAMCYARYSKDRR